MNLQEMGWDPDHEGHFRVLDVGEKCTPGRVMRQDRHTYVVWTQQHELPSEVPGTFRHAAASPADFPAVGDWVAVEPLQGEARGVIRALLPRRSQLSRKAAGARTDEQVVAANVDVVFLVSGLDGGRAFSMRRIERYLSLAREGGAEPVVVLNKVDVCADVDAVVAEARTVARGLPVFAVSATQRTGLEGLREHLGCGVTAALLGSSGVGKSALVNALLGQERQAVHDVRDDDRRGRHTTTRREILVLPSGGLLVDTPGMRELQLWGDEEGLDDAFEDIDALAAHCHFRDCQHAGEPGCAVQAAVGEGVLEARRLENYHDLQRELRHLARRRDEKARRENKAQEKQFGRMVKEVSKARKVRRGEM